MDAKHMYDDPGRRVLERRGGGYGESSPKRVFFTFDPHSIKKG